MNRKDRHFKYRPQRKMKLNQLFVLCFFLFVIFDGTTSQFFGRNTRRKQQPQRVNPSNNQCYYDNQCSTGKCRQLDNIFCGFGSEYIRDIFFSCRVSHIEIEISSLGLFSLFFPFFQIFFSAKMIIALQGNVQNVQQINIVHLENIAHVINVLFHPIINATMKVIVQAIPSVVGEVANYAQVKDLYQV